MRGRLGELRKAPWTLWAYVGLSAAATAVAGILENPSHLWFQPVALAFQAVFAFVLLRGSRAMWWVQVVFGLGIVPFFFIDSYPLWRAPVTGAELALLLAPPSRRYVFLPKPQREQGAGLRDSTAQPQTSWDPDAHDDESRPPGWYLDRDDPSRMRYWDASLGGWQSKTTRAPRKLQRRAREAAAAD